MPRAAGDRGAGILLILLGVAAASPVISRPFLAVAQAMYARVFGTVGNLAGQNSLRNPRRTAATASALMIGLALACTMAIVGDSAKASVDKSIEPTTSSATTSSATCSAASSTGIADEMAQVDGVDTVVRQRFAVHRGRRRRLWRSPRIDPAAVGLRLDMVERRPADFTDGTVLLDESTPRTRASPSATRTTVEDPTGERSGRGRRHLRGQPDHVLPAVTTLETLKDGATETADNALIVRRPGRRAAGLQDGSMR